jgi:hypothetical protein
MIPLAVIPPPIMTPSDIIVGLTRSDAAMRDAAQILVPITQRPVPMLNFNGSALRIGTILTPSIGDGVALCLMPAWNK